MSLKFSLKCSQTSLLVADCSMFCCGDRERSVADHGQTCQWYSRCWDRWRAQALSSTRKSSDRL